MIVFLGYMGSGKSIVGQFVSEFLNLLFVDLDDYIEQKEGVSISELFKKKGDISFRKIEHNHFKTLLESDKNIVLSLGGGTPCYYDHMDLLLNNPNVYSFYLNTGIIELVNRLWLEKDKRPIISAISTQEDLKEFIGKHLFERRPYYQKARYQINVDGKSMEQIRDEVVLHLF